VGAVDELLEEDCARTGAANQLRTIATALNKNSRRICETSRMMLTPNINTGDARYPTTLFL
jgi:hypothetical protein